jgi:hypothetical protein
MAVGFPVKADYITGDVLTANNMNDLSGTLNTIQSVEYAAGKNKIINGDFGVWQRGTSFTLTTGSQSFTADRFRALVNFSAGTSTATQQTFTPGTAPVAGYEGRFFHRITCGSTATYAESSQMIEDVRSFAGQTITLSFWAKASTGFTTGTLLAQNFGSGGSSEVTTAGASLTLTTSWARYTTTINVPSISGKTIGTSSYLRVYFLTATATLNNVTIDHWGVQVEASSTASDFQTATGTIQGELAVCQRYYIRYTATGAYSSFASSAFAQSTTAGTGLFAFPVEMRIAPSSIDSSTLAFSKWDNTHYALTSITLDSATTNSKNAYVYGTGSGMTAGNIGYFGANNSTSAYIGFSSEL